MAKKKKKKYKKPNIPTQALALPRLETVLNQFLNDELDSDQFLAAIRQSMNELGQDAIMEALVGLLGSSSNEQKEALMIAIPKLGNEQTIAHLWYLVQKSKLSTAAKMTALIILKEMGEDVDPNDPGRYFSWRDIQSGNLAEVASMGQFAMRQIVKDLRRQTSIDDVEAVLLNFQNTMNQKGSGPLLTMIEDMVNLGDADGADMLMGLVATGSKPVREAARKELLALSAKNIYPQSELIKSLMQEQFHSAYSTDPAHPWQQQVIIVFERGENQVQALHFLLDFGHPWNGAIKDMFPSRTVSFREYKQEFLDKSDLRGIPQRQITYSRARQFILDAVQANRKNNVELPPEFDNYYHWMERRIIDPSPETLAYAAQVDARTTDGWGEMTEAPVRGQSVITDSSGKKIQLVSLGDGHWDDLDELEELDEDELEEIAFADLLEEVRDFYKSDPDEMDKNLEKILPSQWTIQYLQAGYDKGEEVNDLDEQWIDIYEFISFLRDGDNVPTSLDMIEGKHLSDFVTDYWNEYIQLADKAADLDERRQNLETIRGLYYFLSKQNYISASVAKRVNQAAHQLLQDPNKITPIPS